jgi:hypothetical protein
MDNEIELVMSPHCGEISRDDMTVEVHIYRGSDQDKWTLEVVDQENASTVWDDLFATDQAALDEVMRVIDKDGIASFLRDPSEKLH